MKTIPSKTVVNYPVQYQEYQGKKCLVLPAVWDKDDIHSTAKTAKCPFCGKRHSHGKSEGHRVAHCATNHGENISCIADDGTLLNSDDGYIVVNSK